MAMADRGYELNENRRIAEDVISRLAPHPRLAPATADAARRSFDQMLDKTIQPVPINLHVGTTRQIDITLASLFGNHNPKLSKQERGNLVEALLEQKDLVAAEEAQRNLLNADRTVRRSLRWTMAPLYGSLVALLFTGNQAITALNDYQQADSLLNQNPMFRTHRIYSDTANNLDQASYQLSLNVWGAPEPKEAQALLRAAFAQSQSIQSTTRSKDITDILGTLPARYNSSSGSYQFESQRVKIEALREGAKADANWALELVPPKLLLDRQKADNRYKGWLGISIASAVVGVLGSFIVRRRGVIEIPVEVLR